MSKRARRCSTKRIWERLFWWGGITCLAGAMAAVWFAVPTMIIVSLGSVGLLLCLISVAIEVRRIGFTSENVYALSGCLGLSCGVFGYFFQHIDSVLIGAFVGFLVLYFVSLGAQVRGLWNDTKELWSRWRESRAVKK